MQFFSLLMQTAFAILIGIMKLIGKWTDYHQAGFCERLMYLQCIHYRPISQLQKKFHDENSVIKAKQVLGNSVYDGK